MAHEKAEIIYRGDGRAYQLDTRRERASGQVVARVRELIESGGFLSWSPFGGWSAIAATGGQRATLAAIEQTHARGHLAAGPMIAERRRYLEAQADAKRNAEAAATPTT